MAVTKKRTTTTVVEEYSGRTSAPKSALPEGATNTGYSAGTGDLATGQSDAAVSTSPAILAKKDYEPHSELSLWISKNLTALFAGAFVLIGLVGSAAWWLSRIDNIASQARDDTKDLGTKFDGVKTEMIKLSVEVDQVKKSLSATKR